MGVPGPDGAAGPRPPSMGGAWGAGGPRASGGDGGGHAPRPPARRCALPGCNLEEDGPTSTGGGTVCSTGGSTGVRLLACSYCRAARLGDPGGADGGGAAAAAWEGAGGREGEGGGGGGADGVAHYCTREHQRAHWRQHRPLCRGAAAAAAVAREAASDLI